MSPGTGRGVDGAEVRARALVVAGWTSARAAPDHRSEMVTQWLCGEPLEVLGPAGEDEGWLRCRGPDGYEAWVAAGGLRLVGEDRWGRWTAEAEARSLGTPVEAPGAADPSAPGDGPATPRYLPWGCRVVAEGRGRFRLPGGQEVRVGDPGRVVGPSERRERFPPRGEALVETARSWVGTPYLWGGRTREGADCSGLVQAVFSMHGIRLPRDSVDQLRAGPEVGGVGDASARRPGDLLFFGEDRGSVHHVALWAGGGRILHAADGNGAVAEEDLSEGSGPAGELADRLLAACRPLEEG